MTIQEAIKESHECAVAKDFYSPPLSVPTLLALIITELSEAIEADRKDKYFDDSEWSLAQIGDMLENQKDRHSIQVYQYWLKDTFEDELAGACIRLFDLVGYLGLEIWNPPTKLQEPDIPGNIMEAINQVCVGYTIKDDMPILTFFLSCVLGTIFAIAKKLDFDLWAHIEAAMKYNWLREIKHGKKY